eukprot:403376794
MQRQIKYQPQDQQTPSDQASIANRSEKLQKTENKVQERQRSTSDPQQLCSNDEAALLLKQMIDGLKQMCENQLKIAASQEKMLKQILKQVSHNKQPTCKNKAQPSRSLISGARVAANQQLSLQQQPPMLQPQINLQNQQIGARNVFGIIPRQNRKIIQIKK